MIDTLALALVFLAILNPLSGLVLWGRIVGFAPAGSETRSVLLASLVSLALLVAVAAAGDSLLDLLEITPPTFQIATGVLLVVSVLFVFAPARQYPDPELEQDRGGYWPVIRLILWLASPAALAAAIGYQIEFGLAPTIIGIVIAVAVSAALLARVRGVLVRVPLSLVVWAGRFVGAVVVVLAIDLIRRGVENV